MLECKNVSGEEIAKHLDRLADSFNIWMHDNTLYAIFEVCSLYEVKRLTRALRRIRKAEFKFTKIRRVRGP